MDNEEFDDIDLKSKLDFKIWKRLFTYVKSNIGYFLLAFGFVILLAFLETKIVEMISQDGLGNFVKTIYDENGKSIGLEIINMGKPFTLYILLTSLLILGVFVCNTVFIWACARLELALYKSMTNTTFDFLQGRTYTFYDKYQVGWLMARCTSDSSRVGEIISWGLSDLVWAFFKLIFIFITMLKYSVKLSFVMLAIVPVLLVVSILFRKVVVKYFWRVRKLNSKVTTALNEGIMGSKTSKTLVLENKNLGVFKGIVSKFRKTSLKSTCYTSMYYQSTAFLSACGIGLMAYLGANAVIGVDASIDGATLYLFVTYATMFFDPVLSIARVANQMKQAQVSASRVFNLLDVETDIQDTPEVIEKYGTYKNLKKENWEPLDGEVEFDHVTFAYKTGSQRTILDDFNLKIKKGSSVALVGETGAGKSTIVNLLCRFYQPTEGKILIDGVDYKERSVEWLHANLGYVMQTPHLFSGTIKENILYGNRNATDDQVIAAAKAANAHDFIIKLEDGYNTQVGEGGNRLSQGQKQLISFARAIIADPRILVLDEATSSIDTETEMMIQNAIKNILDGRTSFIIAHRLSTIVNSDLILCINNGKIIESGTHNELMKNKGYYYKLYTNQFVEDQLKSLGV